MRFDRVGWYICAALMCALVVFGCSQGGGGSVADLNGEWKDTADNAKFVINFNGDANTIAYGSEEVSVTIKEVAGDKITLLPAKGSDGEWELVRRWSDNGSSFTLVLVRNGQTHKLVKSS